MLVFYDFLVEKTNSWNIAFDQLHANNDLFG